MDGKWINYADHLEQAVRQGKGVDPLTSLDPDLTIQDAYQVQLINIDKKVKAGSVIVGKKIGLTSLAMQQLLKVDQPDYGHLLDDMVVENGGVIPFSRLLQPRVEAEIAFVLKQDLIGPHVTALDVLLATDYVLPALEIVDSRVADWKIKLQDTVADNASSGLYVLGGKPVKPDAVDLTLVGSVLYKNGEIMNTGVGAAALGDPAACVAWLANKLFEFGITLKAGEVILSGALSAAVHAKPGDHFRARLAHLGEVSVSFEG
ncbi:2-keto-4-pentenoate hydratase [Paenibacillus validus]|uniref:2-keto-4-pentenoate hydratase n=1 Tax=Paenibacillus validus TaxID=44253 RepID=A0A7X3CQ71_9BACL|nr:MULTISPECIES: 2-keto-4-pentenoate hydratase [Paenibacillus]MED4602736.1 2-keto-4-pentenoate hydratase [Paenibacillus validus]MED4607282.1 2-keto-4-pentenoate hydratase [Paenibacillus validus]MUG69340.1 2-keto-4-pentenoate hydratase [Paenibacillus validus]